MLLRQIGIVRSTSGFAEHDDPEPVSVHELNQGLDLKRVCHTLYV